MMNSAPAETINYWPAYVDALINVVLNLLFLVGVFTIGLVSLNAQALFAQQKAAQAKLAALAAERSKEARQSSLHELQRWWSQQARPSAAPRLSPAIQPSVLPQVTQIRLQARSDISATPEDKVSGPGANALTRQNEFEQWVATYAQGARWVRMAFDMNQYSLPPEAPWPIDVSLAPEKSWTLLAMSDPANPAQARASFVRLLFVRNTLIKAGVPTQRIQLQIAPLPTAVTLSPEDLRAVVVIESLP